MNGVLSIGIVEPDALDSVVIDVNGSLATLDPVYAWCVGMGGMVLPSWCGHNHDVGAIVPGVVDVGYTPVVHIINTE